MNDWRRALPAALLLLLVGVAVVARQQQPSPPGSSPTTSSSTTTSTPAPTAAPWWATPVSQLREDARYGREWVRRVVAHGSAGGDDGVWLTEFGLAAAENYGVPEYRATSETPRWLVRRKRPDQWPGFFSIGPNETVPWDPVSWRPANGRDGYAHVIDQNGFLFGFWSLAWWSYEIDVNNRVACTPFPGGATQNLAPPFGVGYDPNTMLCAASAYVVTDPAGRRVRIDGYRGNFPGASGGGFPVRPITPDEVAAGRISHVAHLAIYNTGVGPECAPGDPGYGVSCITAVAPAGQYERRGVPTGPGPNQRTELSVPEGTRFALRITDAELDRWLDSRGYQGRLRQTARTIAVGLREYGMVVGDTTGFGRSITMSGGENPQTAAKWRELGIVGDGKRLLDGLITADRLVAFEPQTNVCSGQERRTWCWAEDVR